MSSDQKQKETISESQERRLSESAQYAIMATVVIMAAIALFSTANF